MMLRRLVLPAVVLGLFVGAGCARKVVPVAPGPDRFPDFSYPLVPADLAKGAAPIVAPHDLAWKALQAGDPREAERQFSVILKRRADFYPSEAGLGYVELARGNEKRALERFDHVVSRAPTYLPGLMGKAQTLLRLERASDALAAFEAVLAVDPSLTDVRRRVETLRFRSLDDMLAGARQAEEAGRLDQARSLYEQAVTASPDSAFLYRELARIERRLDQPDAAIAHATRAIELDPGDGTVFLLLADLHESRQAWDDAIVALEKARGLDPNAVDEARIQMLRDRAAIARLPAEYHAIPQADRVTRGELAALIGTRLEGLLRAARTSRSVLVTDVRGHWAQTWIMAVSRARVMDAFDNHTFQPRAVVRRGDLARAISGVLTLIAQQNPALGKTWAGARYKFTDLGAGNLYYPAASLAVVGGILDAPGGVFQAGRTVTGAEAVAAIDRLEALAAKAVGGPRG